MLEYVTAVKRALRDQHKFKPLPGSTSSEPLLEVPDGTYKVTIDGETDYIRVANGSTMSFLANRKPKKFIPPKVVKNTCIP